MNTAKMRQTVFLLLVVLLIDEAASLLSSFWPSLDWRAQYSVRHLMDTTNIPTCRALGGNLRRLSQDNNDKEVPIFVCTPEGGIGRTVAQLGDDVDPKRAGLEALVPGAFVLNDALPITDCQDILHFFETNDQFNTESGEIAQFFATDDMASRLSRIVSKHVNLDVLFQLSTPSDGVQREDDDIRFTLMGVSKLWHVFRFDSSLVTQSAPHVHLSVSPCRLSDDGAKIEWDASPPGRVIGSKFTLLLFLNDDFTGGYDQFYVSVSERATKGQLLASIKTKMGSILVFPQASNDMTSILHAKNHSPLHTSSPVVRGTKYVIRTDIMVETSRGLAIEDQGNPLFQFDALVREAFHPQSPVFGETFISHLSSLYNPHMGVENAGPLLYALIRFTKFRRVVEIGAGYTSLWILQALRDNDNEMNRIWELQKEGKCRLMDYPWSVEENVRAYMSGQSSLLCIDNCLHQRETASGAAAVAANLGLEDYFEFIQGDAYDMQFDDESIDLLWCDFGVGSRMRDFARGAWRSIRPGGFLVCHSTLTNKGTRDLLEDVRARRDEDLTGIPPAEVVELSLLEPTKLYQNSLTILQRRSSGSGKEFSEPLYSMYAEG